MTSLTSTPRRPARALATATATCAAFAHIIPLPNVSSLPLPSQTLSCPCYPSHRRLAALPTCRLDHHHDVSDNDPLSSTPTAPAIPEAKDIPSTNGLDLVKHDWQQLKDYLIRLISSTTTPTSTTTPSSYQPLSATGKSVAQTFSQFRGTVDRAVSTAQLRAVGTVRTVMMAALTMSKSIQNIAVRLLGNADYSSPWFLLKSFQWQSPTSKYLNSNNPKYNTNSNNSNDNQPDNNEQLSALQNTINERLKLQSRRATVRRALTVRNFSKRSLLTASTIARFGDVIIPKLWSRATAALPIGRKGGALVLVSLGAIVTIVGAPITTFVTGTTIALTSIAVVGARAGVLEKDKTVVKQRMSQRQQRQLPNILPKPVSTNHQAVKRNIEDVKGDQTKSIDTPAHTVSQPKPSVLSIPVIGALLNLLDVVAFGVERITYRSLERLGLKYLRSDSSSNDGWTLLVSFDSYRQK